MKISEVIGDGLMSFVAMIRCATGHGGSTTGQVEIRCDGPAQARYLLAQAYGQDNVLSIRRTVLEQAPKPAQPSKSVIRPIKPKGGVIKPIKPMNPEQAMKKAETDNKRAIKKKERKAKAMDRVKDAQKKLADINREP